MLERRSIPVPLDRGRRAGGFPPARLSSLAGEGSQATVIESTAASAAAAISQCRDRYRGRQGCRRRPLQLQREGDAGLPRRHLRTRAGRDSASSSHIAHAGRRPGAERRARVLDGEGGEASTSTASTSAGGSQHLDHTPGRPRPAALHQPPVLQGHPRRYVARRVHRADHGPPGAQKTDAKQTNLNLLLSERRPRSTPSRSSRSTPTT